MINMKIVITEENGYAVLLAVIEDPIFALQKFSRQYFSQTLAVKILRQHNMHSYYIQLGTTIIDRR